MRRAQAKRLPRDRDNTSILSRNAYTLGLLRGSDRQCIESMRMSGEAYVRLCMHFKHKLWLHDSRHVSIEEKRAMFLTIIGHNERYVVIKRRFQHSSQTMHKYFHEVLATMMTFAREMIVPSTFDPNLNSPGAHKSLRWIFKGAVGALDGTLVHAIIPASQQTVYKGGKGKCYQNVLLICDFNMIFTFVYAGWEGVANDSRVLTEVMAEPSNNFPFPLPNNKYCLCDVAYTNTRKFMAPYRNIRYWLGDFYPRRAMTKEEKFNHAYAKLRNVIERAYGVLNARFPILDKMAHYPFNVQRNVVIACFAFNNFIRKENINDELFV
ncbi:LOW QUALITY PROTEIN: DDE_4 domain-containing protein [Cephalotus follicularis]|uniref:DDE_4 domain-containing protein n=1 Tax=Cephalotus follicularis TaxID=3775 RepID=A0A1Q3D0Z9_CEPFO|nr:LOW QUALITY PROTEIN: DDE_4 domain-containing protein [Cephalotus follicularis]